MQVGERWLYRCPCFALHGDDQKRTGFRYAVSLFQMEYSRNFLFERGRDLERLFQGSIDRTRSRLDLKTVKTIGRNRSAALVAENASRHGESRPQRGQLQM